MGERRPATVNSLCPPARSMTLTHGSGPDTLKRHNKREPMMVRINALIILSICVFISFPSVAATVAADDPSVIGTIEEVEGSATMTHPHQAPVAAAIDMPVRMNDVLETAQDSKVHVLFIDETQITLGEKAKLAVDEYVFDPDNMNSNKGRFS